MEIIQLQTSNGWNCRQELLPSPFIFLNWQYYLVKESHYLPSSSAVRHPISPLRSSRVRIMKYPRMLMSPQIILLGCGGIQLWVQETHTLHAHSCTSTDISNLRQHYVYVHAHKSTMRSKDNLVQFILFVFIGVPGVYPSLPSFNFVKHLPLPPEPWCWPPQGFRM